MIKNALKDSLIYSFSSILSKGLTVFLLPIYTRILSPGEYGAYDLLITVGILANLVVSLEISQGLARYWGDTENSEQKIKLASTTLWFSVLMYSLFLFISELFSPELTHYLFNETRFLPAMKLGLGIIALNGIYLLLLNQFRWELRSREYATVSIIYAGMTLGFVSLYCLGFQMKLEGILLAQLSATSLSLLLSGWWLRKSFNWEFENAALINMLHFSIPLVPAGMAVFISLYINRFALSHFTSIEEVGIFGIGSRIAGLSSLLVIGIQSALTPLIYQNYRNPDTPAHIAKLFHGFLSVALIGCLSLILFAEEILSIFTTPDYIDSAILVSYLAPAILLSQMYIFAPGIAIRKKTHWQLWITLCSAIISIIGNGLLVPIWGTVGAALATLLSSTIFLSLWLIASQRLYQIPYAKTQIGTSSVAFIICLLLGNHLGQINLPYMHIFIIKLGCLIFLMLVILMTRLLPISGVYTFLSILKSYVCHPFANPKNS